jgi:phage virion morphogenesis protein
MTSFTIDVHDQAVQAAMRTLQQRVQHMQPVLEAIGQKMVERVDARFSTQIGPDGLRWKDNSPATEKRKGPRPVLTDSGDLRQSIAHMAADSAVTLSASQPYAAIQQCGTIEREARTATIHHRTNSRGELLRSDIMNGKGLIFARTKASRAHATSRVLGCPAHAGMDPLTASKGHPGRRFLCPAPRRAGF